MSFWEDLSGGIKATIVIGGILLVVIIIVRMMEPSANIPPPPQGIPAGMARPN